MEVLDLARLQFASTTIFHFIFVPISIGLSFLIAVMQTMYVAKKDEKYKQLAKFWGTFLLINFAVGIVTGILQEFQFGMNWSEFSRFVGDIFGAPLAIEALLAFFLESTFIGIWVFGWDRLSKGLHLVCIWLVAIGTVLSAFWILAANAFMQRPVGFVINEGRAEMTDLGALLTNGRLLWEFPHTVAAGFATGAFLVAGISAWKLLKKKQVDFFRTSFKLSIVTAVIASIAIALFGHGQAQYMAETQPMKMAAAEGLWETSSDPAPFTLFALIDPVTQENKFEVKVPYMLSILTHNKLTGSIPGMNDIQAAYEEQFGEGNYIPPVRTTFWSFRIMVGSGVLMILLALYGTFMALRNKWASLGNKFFYMMVAAIGLPFIGNTAGWIMTEVGRQPWTVFGLFKTEDSVSPSVSAGEVLFSLIGFSFMYLILLGVLVYLFARTARKGPVIVTDDSPVDETEEEYDPYDVEGSGRIVTS